MSIEPENAYYEHDDITVNGIDNESNNIMKQNNTDQNISKLFEYIRNHEWSKFNSLIDADDTLDINVRDNQGNHLLTYAVRFNRIDIVNKLFEKGAKYDIVDKMERSILYDAIESNFYDIIVRLLEISEKNVGVMITDIHDINNEIPLHYAIKFKNVEIVKLLIKYKSNPYTIDSSSYNALHLAARSGRIDIVECITKVMTNLDAKTNKGETALHISINYQYNQITKFLLEDGAEPNIADSDNEFTPLHYAVGWNNTEVIELLFQKGADPNKQDIYGNIPLMYCVKEDYPYCFNIMMEHKINLNLWNIDGKIVLHEVLENYDESSESKNIYLDKLLPNSSLSLQDSQGNTCLHYLVILDIWQKYINILKKKKLDIFVKNSAGKAVIDLFFITNKNDDQRIYNYNLFMDTLTESYIYILKKEKKNWASELDKICSRQLSELTIDEKKYIADNVNNQNELDNDCTLLIRNKLNSDIKKYKDGKLNYCQRSYPIDINYIECIKLDQGPILDVCTFTGSLLDVLIGLIFLIKKHNNACTTLKKNYTTNDELRNFYKSMGLIMNGRGEFINFEIVWIDYKLYIMDDFSNLFNDCIKSKARFIIIPLGIEMKSGSHANYLIYDKNIKEIERFEPHGGTTPIGFNYNSQFLDEILADYFKSIDNDIQYIKPNQFIPKIGFQLMDSQEENKHRIGDPGGFCALWSIWYVDQRLTYYTYDRTRLIKSLFYNIKAQGLSYRNMIRNYSQNISKERDKMLKMINIDINDWLNDNYTNNQLDKFIAYLMIEINTHCIPKIK